MIATWSLHDRPREQCMIATWSVHVQPRDQCMIEKGTTEDEMAGWHHWLDGRESEWTPGVGDGHVGLVCCDSWGCKESDMTERLNWTELIDIIFSVLFHRVNLLSFIFVGLFWFCLWVYMYIFSHSFYCCYKPLPLLWAFAVLWSFPFFPFLFLLPFVFFSLFYNFSF